MNSPPPDSRVIPLPAAGMQLAQRPTGVFVALIIAVLAMLATSLLPLIYGIVQGVQIGLAGGTVPVTTQPQGRIELAIAIFSFVFGAGVIFWWVRAKERRPIASLGFPRLHGAAHSLTAGSATALGTPPLTAALRGGLFALLMMTLSVFVPVITGQAELIWRAPELSATAWSFIVLMLVGFLLQGSTEEIITRGFLTQAVARKWGLAAAVIIQAVFFAAFHGANPGIGVMPLINLVLFAIFASMLTLADGSLWGICAFHGIWNWAQGNLFGVAVSGNIITDSVVSYAPAAGSSDLVTGGTFGVEGSLITTLLYIVGAIIAWRVHRRRASERAQTLPSE